ncbi:alpha-L-Rha alpha-1,3-L-rhamnosyltransferase [Photobacterium sp. GB-50]|uniref:glycosyltransferase family 2 protein n=1 Tax=Photobacterium sp. GB-50 TaxID=2022107 RepID=UPI000D16E044|nr:glycosyltransferase family 2 protein [Photobacterium sp. GB-50]PSW74721.1 alpha-L-Rha alpha-1,3-L-rhamnosyltransferase [Photobacterium sp. GB-50]
MISVCLASYNGHKYIKEQLLSILKQLSDDDELIISDDGSTDSTISIIESIGDPRVKLFNGPQTGLIDNFFNALSLAKGDIIFLADQDDIWLPNKVEKYCIEFEHKNADLVLSDCSIVDENKNVLFPSFFEVNGSDRGLLKNIIKNSYLGCCMAFRRELLDSILENKAYGNIPMHDWYIGLVAECLNLNIIFLSEPMLLYRRHGNNVSPSGEKSKNSIWVKLSYRVKLIYSLICLRLK